MMAGPIIPINSLALLCTSADLPWCARATTRQLRASALYASDARQINWRGTLRQYMCLTGLRIASSPRQMNWRDSYNVNAKSFGAELQPRQTPRGLGFHNVRANDPGTVSMDSGPTTNRKSIRYGGADPRQGNWHRISVPRQIWCWSTCQLNIQRRYYHASCLGVVEVTFSVNLIGVSFMGQIWKQFFERFTIGNSLR